ncbi:hypothetical protein D3C87_923440 [compost metagenome]
MVVDQHPAQAVAVEDNHQAFELIDGPEALFPHRAGHEAIQREGRLVVAGKALQRVAEVAFQEGAMLGGALSPEHQQARVHHHRSPDMAEQVRRRLAHGPVSVPHRLAQGGEHLAAEEGRERLEGRNHARAESRRAQVAAKGGDRLGIMKLDEAVDHQLMRRVIGNVEKGGEQGDQARLLTLHHDLKGFCNSHRMTHLRNRLGDRPARELPVQMGHDADQCRSRRAHFRQHGPQPVDDRNSERKQGLLRLAHDFLVLAGQGPGDRFDRRRLLGHLQALDRRDLDGVNGIAQTLDERFYRLGGLEPPQRRHGCPTDDRMGIGRESDHGLLDRAFAEAPHAVDGGEAVIGLGIVERHQEELQRDAVPAGRQRADHRRPHRGVRVVDAGLEVEARALEAPTDDEVRELQPAQDDQQGDQEAEAGRGEIQQERTGAQ